MCQGKELNMPLNQGKIILKKRYFFEFSSIEFKYTAVCELSRQQPNI